ncbi:MAG TPA: hypothetical protein VJV78_15105 [Polyangiales bacterium]|nr:hypothetical protein [Polyangiales bacterium]
MIKSTLETTVFALTLLGTALSPVARADCPAIGEAQLHWKNTSTALPGNTSDFLTLVQDTCTDADPPATFVTAKLQLENQTDTTQLAECWLSTTKSSDYAQVTLAPKGRTVITLTIANVSGGDLNANRASVMCRNAAASPNTVHAAWLKVLTKVVRSVQAFQVP